jgi:hypothetical protein
VRDVPPGPRPDDELGFGEGVHALDRPSSRRAAVSRRSGHAGGDSGVAGVGSRRHPSPLPVATTGRHAEGKLSAPWVGDCRPGTERNRASVPIPDRRWADDVGRDLRIARRRRRTDSGATVPSRWGWRRRLVGWRATGVVVVLCCLGVLRAHGDAGPSRPWWARSRHPAAPGGVTPLANETCRPSARRTRRWTGRPASSATPASLASPFLRSLAAGGCRCVRPVYRQPPAGGRPFGCARTKGSP